MNRVETDSVSVPCSLDAVYAARQEIRRLTERHGLGGEHVDDLVLAVSEAVTNAIRYGCPAGEDVELRWTIEGSCVSVEIQDRGVFRKRIPLPDLEDAHGRGIPLMIALVDELHIREGTRRSPGTVVRLVKCRSR